MSRSAVLLLLMALTAAPWVPATAHAQAPEVDPFETRFHAALALYRDGQYAQAFAAFYPLAQQRPDSRVLGTLGAVAANQVEDDAFVRRWTERADASPNDPIANYVAGIVMHYTAHSRMNSRERKRPYYRRCLGYLARTLPTLEHVQRVWIYSAVSHHRLGELGPARVAIDRAVRLGLDDPDVLYCRAEITHRENPRAAIADLEQYLLLMRRNARRGAVVSPSKEARVEEMLVYVRAVAAGEVPATDLWDSLDDEMWSDPRAVWWWTRRRAPHLAVSAVGLAAAVYALRRWRRRRRD